MIILEPSDNQNERSPLTKGVETTTPSAALATAPPPYAPTVPPNPIPSYQTVPQHSLAHHVIISRRRSPFRRLLVAFAIACLVLLLWGTFLDSLNEVFKRFSSDGFRHGYGYKLVRLRYIYFMLLD